MDTKKAPIEFQGLSEVELEDIQLDTIYFISVNIPP